MKLIDAAPSNKQIILGTALWGWGMTRTEAFNILDFYSDKGGIIVDTATNYPINKREEDYGLAISWLRDWMQMHSNDKMSIIVKIGSKNNMGGSEVDLSQRTIIETTKRLRGVFGNSLSCISIHWDDRVDEKKEQKAIAQTVEAMSMVHEMGLDIGLSGIKDPRLYYQSSPILAGEWIIQVKENFFTNYSRFSYERYFPSARYFAYGINMGGIKLKNYSIDSSVNLRGISLNSAFVSKLQHLLEISANIDPQPTDINHLSLAFTHSNESLSGVIIGPRNVRQLEETIRYWTELQNLASRAEWSEFFSAVKLIDS